ncbi:MAG: 4'-phosphopantetheinyl transferase [Candidatus Azotimanducaceae bacterium]|jgi:4'-phosphopantetheinyl transferase
MDVETYFCRIDPKDYGWGATLSSKLTLSDQDRAAKFRFDRDRASFVVAHVLFEKIVRPCLPARGWFLETNIFGKPMISPNTLGIYFNLSHTTGMVALGVSQGTDIGVDVEQVSKGKTYEDIHKTVLTSHERSAVIAHADPKDRFIQSWAAKEAILKAMGTGLSVPAKDIEVLSGRVTKIPPAFGQPDEWCVQTQTHNGWWSAVAARTPKLTEKQTFLEISDLF